MLPQSPVCAVLTTRPLTIDSYRGSESSERRTVWPWNFAAGPVVSTKLVLLTFLLEAESAVTLFLAVLNLNAQYPSRLERVCLSVEANALPIRTPVLLGTADCM